jgi:hypothetical protein
MPILVLPIGTKITKFVQICYKHVRQQCSTGSAPTYVYSQQLSTISNAVFKSLIYSLLNRWECTENLSRAIWSIIVHLIRHVVGQISVTLKIHQHYSETYILGNCIALHNYLLASDIQPLLFSTWFAITWSVHEQLITRIFNFHSVSTRCRKLLLCNNIRLNTAHGPGKDLRLAALQSAGWMNYFIRVYRV